MIGLGANTLGAISKTVKGVALKKCYSFQLWFAQIQISSLWHKNMKKVTGGCSSFYSPGLYIDLIILNWITIFKYKKNKLLYKQNFKNQEKYREREAGGENFLRTISYRIKVSVTTNTDDYLLSHESWVAKVERGYHSFVQASELPNISSWLVYDIESWTRWVYGWFNRTICL